MKKYIICGLNTECDFRHGIMVSRSEKYLADFDKADISIPYPATEMAVYDVAAPHLTTEERELMCTGRTFYTELLNFHGFMLHSSAVAVDGKAYLFSAPSGTGKSTHTEQWLKLFGERAQIINDDKPAIRIETDGIFAYGTPWSGKSDLNINGRFDIAGICVLERAEKNYIVPLDEGTAVYSILNQTIRPSDPLKMATLLSHLDKVIKAVPVWKMGCNISTEAAEIAYKAMSKTE